MRTFLILSQQPKKQLLVFSVFLCFCLLFSVQDICLASETQKEATYQITETELVQLENNLAQLQSINTKLQMELTAQKRELHVLREESSRLLRQLNTLQQQSQTQETSLATANKLLETYATEEKRTRLRIKAQRNGWIAATLVACIALITK